MLVIGFLMIRRAWQLQLKFTPAGHRTESVPKNGLSLSLVGFHVSFASTESSIKVIFNLICKQRCFFCFGRCRCLKLKLIGRVLSFHLRGIDPVIVEREWERKTLRVRKKLWEDFVDCKAQAAGGKRGEEVMFCWIPSGSGLDSTHDRQKLRNVPQGEKITKKLGRN